MWCRHQESNPGPTDYKEGALNNKINDLRDFLLRAWLTQALQRVRVLIPIT